MTKTEEAHMLRDIKRTAAATERIAKALEQLVKMATYDAEDYVKLGKEEGSKTVDGLYVICNKEGEAIDVLSDKEEAERIVASDTDALHVEEFKPGDVISVQKIEKEEE